MIPIKDADGQTAYRLKAMRRGNGHMHRLKGQRVAAFVALYALVLEIFFGAMHAAALAASAFGPPRNPQSFIFQICTPGGLISVRLVEPNGKADRETTPGSRKAASDFCPVCGSTAVSPFTFAPPATVPPASQSLAGVLVPHQLTGRSLTAWRSVHIRAPPLS